MSRAVEVENVIVGGGPAGSACARALEDRGASYTMIISGEDLRDRIRSRRETVRRAIVDTGNPPPEVRFGSLTEPGSSASRKALLGIDRMYQESSAVVIATVGDTPIRAAPSSGAGGYSLVWGASLMPLRMADTYGWPSYLRDLSSWYETAAAYVPYSARRDALEADFPLYGRPNPAQEPAAPIADLLRGFGSVNTASFTVGASRLAVDNDPDSPTHCRQCGWCLSGCAWDSIFHSDFLYNDSALADVIVATSVIDLDEGDDHVLVKTLGPRGDVGLMRAQRVFLAAGPLVSTALVCRAADLPSAEIRDNQAITVPLLLRRGRGDAAETRNVSLAQAFLEEIDESSGRSRVHWQVYPRGPELTSLLDSAPPRGLPRFAGRLSAKIMNPAHGFLDSSVSGSIRIRATSTNHQLRIEAEAHRPTPVLDEALRRTKRLSRALRSANGSMVPTALRTVEPVGASYHLASSFPHKEPGFSGSGSSDESGRPAGLRRTHLVDASVLPNMPPQSPTFTVMANATRIGSIPD